MLNRSIAGLVLAAFIAVPTIAGAQMSSSTPKPSGTPKATSFKKSLKKAAHGTPAMSSSTTHSAKSGQAQSTDPGAPNYTGSSGTGK